ncbi:hypothetical protein FB45DRAFT_435519 [Roridomyces roridus]|uniref:Uncharacterized protein n=1 Tax=Roridomyces roridus TaxID=1738132 RepID=A0AAD7B0N8_9AGAR|nr:hypothetical protein FB45DRAFT_435519 [Roridomyces roridus]
MQQMHSVQSCTTPPREIQRSRSRRTERPEPANDQAEHAARVTVFGIVDTVLDRIIMYRAQRQQSAHHTLREKIPYLLNSYRPHPQATRDDSLNALLIRIDQVATTGLEAFIYLIALSDLVALTDVQLFSQRGTFIDTLNPLYEAYMSFVETATEAHAACAAYIFCRRQMCSASADAALLEGQIREAIGAFTGCLHRLSRHADAINIQWKVSTDALRVAVNSYSMAPSFVSILSWVDSRNATRLDLPSLVDALPESIQKSTDGVNKLYMAYVQLEKALNQVHDSGLESLGSESDFGIALLQLIQLDTAILRYRACLLISNGWRADKCK